MRLKGGTVFASLSLFSNAEVLERKEADGQGRTHYFGRPRQARLGAGTWPRDLLSSPGRPPLSGPLFLLEPLYPCVNVCEAP